MKSKILHGIVEKGEFQERCQKEKFIRTRGMLIVRSVKLFVQLRNLL